MSSFAPILSDMILLSRLQSNLLVTVIWPASLLFVLYFLEEKKVLKSVASFARYFSFPISAEAELDIGLGKVAEQVESVGGDRMILIDEYDRLQIN